MNRRPAKLNPSRHTPPARQASAEDADHEWWEAIGVWLGIIGLFALALGAAWLQG